MADKDERDEAKPRPEKTPAGDAGATPGSGVRPAGPEAMKIPPRGWTKTDEEVDESFPASDPPGNY